MQRSDITLPDVHADEIDAVPVFWAPVDGPFTAVLHFDGGICAEAAHQRGIQHLIEHLVLTAVGPQSYEYNGFVDMRRVAFTVRGEVEEVRQFFDVVTAGLNEIPQERSAHESGVLGAEASRTSGSTLTNLLSYMFGSAGPGVAALPELAAGVVADQDLTAWAHSRMTRGQAAMFCSGDPSFLDLSAIPSGERLPRWEMPEAIDGPGWAPNNASGFAAVAVMRRSTANATMIRTLREHCLDHVRHQQGVSYSVETLYEPLTPEDVMVGIFVDATPDRRVDARNTLFAALDSFAAHGPEQRWVDLDADRFARGTRERGAGVSRAANAAVDHCLGREDPLSDDWLDELVELTAPDLAAAAREFLSTASWQMPNEAPMPPWRQVRRLRLFSDAAVDGRDLVPKAPSPFRMVAGPAGISAVHGADRIGTVCFDDVVASEAWEDGTRFVYGRDGTTLRFFPTEWAEGPDFLHWLDGNLARAPFLRRAGRPA